MTSCKLLVYYPDDFRIVSGSIHNQSPLTVKLDIAPEELSGALQTRLKWYEGNVSKNASASLSGGEEGLYTGELTSDVKTDENDSHFIEYREYFDVLKADSSNSGDLKHRTDSINSRFRSSLSTQVKKIITDESLTNQYLFKLLLQIDEKMDQLLDSLKEDDVLEGLSPAKMLSFGGNSLAFIYSGNDMKTGDLVYIQSLPKGGTGINFAALCRVQNIISSPAGQICEAGYDYIDETTRESIIHYIFQKEREQLKRKN